MNRLFVSVLCVLLLAGPALSEQSVAPGINAPYRNADPEVWREIFESEGREIWEHRQAIVEALDLQPGMRVADIGAGTGFFSLMFANKVGLQGRVYAVDISSNFIDAIKQRAAGAGLNNITGVINNPHSVMLPDNSIDLAFISDTYHHFEYPLSTLKSIHAALKPGGEMVIIDYKLAVEVSTPWVKSHVRVGEVRVRQEVAAAGFDLVESRELMRTQYYLRFRKR